MKEQNDLTLTLPNFSGPLDLLLHLIQSQAIDIYDIPIAKITGQYLEYLAKWQKLDLQIAGEYFVMASTLLRIKSQYLLPKNDFIEPEDQPDDPREELVEQLVQYSIFKKISEYLKQRNEEVPLTVSKEPSVSNENEIQPLPLGKISSQQLVDAFNMVIHRYKLRNPNAGEIKVEEASIEDMTRDLTKRLAQNKRLSFFKYVKTLHNVDEALSLFLAILELCRHQKLKIIQRKNFSDLILEGTADGN
ncbi:segregation and condensation protein A [Lactobacillus colini]|uniref:Segregation and condensation protein A n=1 Tax=Lactobacillus colini TaxID=1819254 RepID=A0ABS4ME74_9LACO|nr:segregation/condensation protein A [Lactobacillus colini]MBP2057978.1 segregation and condensation protein A [Lactobacillus colini]